MRGRRVVPYGNGRPAEFAPVFARLRRRVKHRLAEQPTVVRPALARLRWRMKQVAAGQSRYYGDGGTVHHGGSLDVEVSDGRVVAVWFRCQQLPFRQSDVDASRAQEMDGAGPDAEITGVEVREP